jgi:hypothetical protein
MGLSRTAAALGALVALCSCDVLFPEFSGKPPPDLASAGDGGSSDASSTPHLQGQVCALGDARDYRTCSVGLGGPYRITVEETRDQTMTDSSGSFTLTTARPLTIATVAVIDTSGTFTPTVTALHPAGGVLERLALPVLAAQVLGNMELSSGVSPDATRGAVVVWTVDATGAPVAGVRSTPPPLAAGPFYEGAQVNELMQGQATGSHGLLAFFDVGAGTARLGLQPPSPYFADSYELPIRSGAVTLSALPLH